MAAKLSMLSCLVSILPTTNATGQSIEHHHGDAGRKASFVSAGSSMSLQIIVVDISTVSMVDVIISGFAVGIVVILPVLFRDPV